MSQILAILLAVAQMPMMPSTQKANQAGVTRAQQNLIDAREKTKAAADLLSGTTKAALVQMKALFGKVDALELQSRSFQDSIEELEKRIDWLASRVQGTPVRPGGGAVGPIGTEAPKAMAMSDEASVPIQPAVAKERDPRVEEFLKGLPAERVETRTRLDAIERDLEALWKRVEGLAAQPLPKAAEQPIKFSDTIVRAPEPDWIGWRYGILAAIVGSIATGIAYFFCGMSGRRA